MKCPYCHKEIPEKCKKCVKCFADLTKNIKKTEEKKNGA